MIKRGSDDAHTSITVSDEYRKTKRADLVTKRYESTKRRDCPYLGTINRHVLDFDFEKICSVSLSTNNIYACLVCGKYYQG